MKLDLSHFKKVSENKHSAVLRHPKGHHIVISKKSLNPKLQSELAALPMDGAMREAQSSPMALARGGKVRKYAEGDEIAPMTAADMPAEIHSSGGPPEEGDSGQTMEEAPMEAPVSQTPQKYNIPMTPPTSTGLPQQGGMMEDLQKGFAQQAGGIQMQAQAQAQFAQSQANLAKQRADDLSAIHKQYQESLLKNQQDISAAMQDVKDGHINPNHYLQSLSAPGKISTAIGLILGGIGGGMTGKPNAALEFLNAQIGRDVQAQQMELGKKENILSAYMKQTGNIGDALSMTRAFYADLYGAQVQEAAGRVGTPQAQAAAQMALGQLNQQKVAALGPMAMKQAAVTAMSSGQIQDPSSLVPLMVPKERQAEVFKEISTAQDAVRNEKNAMKLFEQAVKENVFLKTWMVRTPGSILALNALVLPMIKNEAGRVNEAEQSALSAVMPKPGDSSYTIAQKRMGFEAFMNGKKAAPTAKGYGIDLSRFATTGRHDKLQPNPSMTAMEPGK